ncbi:PREDICTED: double-strand break repair protein MRE11-like [Drosophila arizonae]|uniref:Double-strand break repair protein MRE11-like n=1 Tax=Drosophila arizonae TaxID=7263 RepID=A0ABM1NPK1_DROAR|nr:PREDICTED: double-strand break repair protein MRE11-like [Drosophila arizonae]
MAGTVAVGNNADDSIRILVATDNHLGYAEKDAVRGEDSFTTFEEILELAVSENVDMILLGGDLFHDSVPSQNALYKCFELLRRYTFGDKSVSLEILSDQSLSFHSALNHSVNYEDPYLKISIPVFSIHGNHDDPSGFGRLSSLDLLSTTGLINYFGHWTDLSRVEINPILIRKGETKLALYGLSHIPDAQLVRMLEKSEINFNNDNLSGEGWYQLMVVHQNRVDRGGSKKYLPEDRLPDFVNMVIWGHEHDCYVDFKQSASGHFKVYQPGSSVATSLIKGESKTKHVGLLTINKLNESLKPLPLQTVRPFVYESIDLDDLVEKLHLNEGDAAEKVYNFAIKRVEALIERAKGLLTGHPKQPTIPLIRLRLRYTDETHMFNTIRFGHLFGARVANVADVVRFTRLTENDTANAAVESGMEVDDLTTLEDLLGRYIEDIPLTLFHSKVLKEVTLRMVKHSDGHEAGQIFKYYSDKVVEHLMQKMPSLENIQDEIENFRRRYKADDILNALNSLGTKTRNKRPAVNRSAVPNDALTTSGGEPSSRGGLAATKRLRIFN